MADAAFPELQELERLVEVGQDWLETRRLGEVESLGRRFPLLCLCLGTGRRRCPAVGFFGGIHGLERIGSRVVLAFLAGLLARLPWDALLRRQLDNLRLVFMPLVNPGGMWAATRCNPRGVDLMRNAPVDSREHPLPFLGGQRLSARLPWYRGRPEDGMEVESQALCRVVEEELLTRRFSIALDCHSGFGLMDRIWFPHAHTVAPMARLAEVYALNELFEHSYPSHCYLFEPQSRNYLAHGDLWDYLCLGAGQERVFLPLTLEMGSWAWVRKSPRQLFSREGLFNPGPPHRLKRTLRRHLLWLDFLSRAASSHRDWLPRGSARDEHQGAALARWYGAGQP